MRVTPQRVNRGGNLAPDEVVGRDAFIGKLWRTLERQSVLLTAERRMGKTSVVKKMRDEAPAEVTAVYRSFEAVRTRKEFVEAVLTDLRDHLPAKLKAQHKLTALVQGIGSVEAGPISLTVAPTDGWKGFLQRVFATFHDTGGQLVLFWDEVPVMLGGVSETEGPEAARELLDTLRVVRQTNDPVRMVFTGSVGLHHVVAAIRSDDYVSAPTNDMLTVTLEGLPNADAVQLAANLFAGEGLAADEAVAAAVADHTSCIPFYIQHVVGELCDRGGTRAGRITIEDVAGVVEDALRDPVDAWEFRQYRARIGTYYGVRADVAFAVLDALAVADGSLPFDVLLNLVNTQLDVATPVVREVLELLQLDHYAVRRGEGYAFAFDIVARSWRVQRDLT